MYLPFRIAESYVISFTISNKKKNYIQKNNNYPTELP